MRKKGGNAPLGIVRANTYEDYIKLREKFEKDKKLVNAANCFEFSDTDKNINVTVETVYNPNLSDCNEYSISNYLKTSILSNNNIPIFTKFAEKKINGFTPLSENENAMLILNAALPYRALSKPEDNAGMSYVHIMAIPKKRIYNAITLKYDDIALLNSMKELVINYLKDKNNRRKVGEIVRGNVTQKLDTTQLIEQNQEDYTKFISDDFDFNNLQFVFHVHPYPSVGHLHMHVLLPTLRTNYAHEWKNMPLECVMKYLEKLPTLGGNNSKAKKPTTKKPIKKM